MARRFVKNLGMRHSTHACGLTLLEVMVALAIAGIVFALGVPAFGSFLSEQQVQDRAEALLHALDVARSEAIKRGGRVDVCPGDGGCTAGALPWEGGWVVVPDASRGDDAAVVVRERTSIAGITIRGNRPVADYVSYTGAGRARRFEGGLQMGTFTICRTGQRPRKVILANSGRARIEIASDRCP